MSLKFLVIFIASCATYHCHSQSVAVNKETGKTIYITQYDSNPPPLNFRSFGVKDGLPRGEVTDFVQTDDGFVWFTVTRLGLVRFDGYHFKVFKTTEDDSTSLPNDHFFWMAKSHNNGLWLASAYGIIWFDLISYKSRLIRLPAEFPGKFYRLFEDSKGRLWIHYDQILYLYEPGNNKFTQIKYSVATNAFNNKTVNIDNASFYAVHESKNGDLFFLGNFLLKFNPETFAFVFYKKINDYFPFNSFAVDENEKLIWLCDWNGLAKFNYEKDSLVHYDFDKIRSEANNGNRSFVAEKNGGQLWLINKRQIWVFDKSTGRMTLYNNNNGNLPVNEFKAKGIDGIEWFWTLKIGFTNLNPATNRFKYHKILPANERVLCQWHDLRNNTIWYGSESRNDKAHLYKYKTTTGELTQVEFPVKGINAPRFIIPLQNDTCMVATADISPLYRKFAPYGKLFLLNTATNAVTYIVKAISNNNRLTSDSLMYHNAYADKAGDYWITTGGQGLIHCEIKKQQFIQYVFNPKDTTTLSANYLYAAACGRDSTIWTGNDYEEDNILNKLNALTGKVQRISLFPGDFTVQPLCEDRKGNVWISTHSGLVCYNRYTGEKYKVPKFSHLFTMAYEDSNGNIILLAPDGLWFYDPVKRFARRFDDQDGIKLEYFEDDYIFKRILLLNDTLFISDTYQFPVSDLYPQRVVPPIHFTGVKIFGRTITSTKNIDAVDTLLFQHNENQLSFDFAALSFLPIERNIYACMLQGVDTGWQQLGADNSITYANLSPGYYVFKIKTANLDGVWGEERKLYFRIIPAFWQTIWFKILLILPVAAFFYWLYKNRLYKNNLKSRLENERLETQKREAEFKTKLSEVELSALRSQMNPHFIFNCLNSIKLYTLQNDSLAASDYLTKFSRLIRLVLENSVKERVELQSELESLRLYIEMEAMRFKEKLQYTITEKIDISYLEIPPLLIQPYVENAIWHGLMHKETGGNISIVIDNGDQEGFLRIIVTDDGIGREKAAQLKSKSAVNQKSFGMKVTSERIALINQLFDATTTVQIIDLYQDNGEAAGTQVIMQIPV